MKLTLSVPLIWMLFSSAGALKCVQDSHSSDLQLCNSDEQCLTAALQELRDNEVTENVTLKTCAPSSFCNEGNQTFSVSYDKFRMTSSLQCCSTDGCNSKDIPYPDEQKPNGLQCVTCHQNDLFCNKTRQCMGMEDRCITVNETIDGRTHLVRGCASANVCEGHTDLKLSILFDQSLREENIHFSAPECCKTSLCNSAPADRLSVISLLFALAALSVC